MEQEEELKLGIFCYAILFATCGFQVAVGQVAWLFRSHLGTSSIQDDVHPSIISIESEEPAKKSGTSIRFGLTRKDFEAISAHVQPFGKAVPIRWVESKVLFANKELKCQIVGTNENFELTGTAKTTKGRFLSAQDARKSDNVCVVNESTARRLFDEANPIGKSLRINKQQFVIVGVAKTKHPTSLKNENVVLIPISTMRIRLGDTHINAAKGRFQATTIELHEIRICVKKTADAKNVFSTAKTLLRKIHPTNDYTIQFENPTRRKN